MRPNQQNNKQRSRGRNNNNNQRRGGGGNPLSRNYESNGPDVKIRGNAAHIAEKYVQLSRDAASVGDNVMAENYLQHAEHYFRIILAAQAQFQPRPDQFADSGNEDDEEDQGVHVNGDAGDTPEQQAAEDEGAEANRDGRRSQRQRRPRREDRDGNTAEAQPETVEAEAAVDEEGEDRPRRARRQRRAPRGEAGADLADAPQPELPAFLTAGREAAAE